MDTERDDSDSVVNMEDVLNWTARMTVEDNGCSERVGIIKSILYHMTSAELKLIPSILSHAKGRMTKLETKWREVRSGELGMDMVAPAPAEIALSIPEKSIVPYPTPFEFREMIKFQGWWKKFKKEDFLGFDVEFVEILGNIAHDVHKAGIVGVWKNEQVYLHQQVKWDRTKVKITPFSIKLNGITYDSLNTGLDFTEMKSKISNLFNKKIILTVGGNKDFRSLDLDANEFNTFDLQSFYNRTDPNNPAQQQGMSLRDIMFYHFKSDCQKGVHSALQDARNTHTCFFGGYVQDKRFWNNDGLKDICFNDVVNLNS